MPPVIRIIAGPTAVGKTALALRWAREHGAQIINADSLLFYRGMDIGTAKPSAAEREAVRHHLIDTNAPYEPMSIKRYAEASRAVVTGLTQQGTPILVVGGSGFYLKSFFSPVVDAVEASPEVRARVDGLEQQGLAALVDALRKASPDGTGGVHLLNPRRVARALERCLITGRSVPQLEADFAALPRPFAEYEKRLCLLLAPNHVLHPRIDLRTRTMLEQGLIPEVERLLAAGIERNLAATSAIGYRETIAWLQAQQPHAASQPDATTGEAAPTAAANNGTSGSSTADAHADATSAPLPPSPDALREQICLNTRRLVAKQRKWFRTQVRPDLILERGGHNDDAMLYQRMCAAFATHPKQ